MQRRHEIESGLLADNFKLPVGGNYNVRRGDVSNLGVDFFEIFSYFDQGINEVPEKFLRRANISDFVSVD